MVHNKAYVERLAAMFYANFIKAKVRSGLTSSHQNYTQTKPNRNKLSQKTEIHSRGAVGDSGSYFINVTNSEKAELKK